MVVQGRLELCSAFIAFVTHACILCPQDNVVRIAGPESLSTHYINNVDVGECGRLVLLAHINLCLKVSHPAPPCLLSSSGSPERL